MSLLNLTLLPKRRPGHLGIALVIGSVAISALAAQQPRSRERDRDAVLALEREWIDARDSSTLDRILADDFLHPVPTGQIITKAQTISWTIKHPLPTSLHARFASLDVRVWGDAAVATGSVATSDSTGRVIDRNVFTDVFVYRHGRWQAVNAQETQVVAMPARTPPGQRGSLDR